MLESPRRRARKLTEEFFASPVLPMLGWTEAVKTFVAGGKTPTWVFYAAVVTALWVYADYIRENVEEAAEEASEKVEEATE
jgi:hypothetical protein